MRGVSLAFEPPVFSFKVSLVLFSFIMDLIKRIVGKVGFTIDERVENVNSKNDELEDVDVTVEC